MVYLILLFCGVGVVFVGSVFGIIAVMAWTAQEQRELLEIKNHASRLVFLKEKNYRAYVVIRLLELVGNLAAPVLYVGLILLGAWALMSFWKGF